MLIAEDAALL